MALIGELRHSITIRRDDSTRGASGALKPWSGTITTIATVWGKLEAAGKPRESFGSPDWAVSVGDWTWRIRNRADLTPKMRVYFGARIFEILSVQAIPTQPYMMLPCKEII